MFDEEGNLVAISNSSRSGFHTFVEFTTGIYSNAQSYEFSLGHACVLKMMWGGAYTDGTSGTMTATLIGPTTWQEHDFAMDSTPRSIQFNGNAFTCALPAGDYSLTLWPDILKSYISVGSVYSLDY